MKTTLIVLLACISLVGCKKEEEAFKPESSKPGTCVDQPRIDRLLALSDENLLSVTYPNYWAVPRDSQAGLCEIGTKVYAQTDQKAYVLFSGTNVIDEQEVQLNIVTSMRAALKNCQCGL